MTINSITLQQLINFLAPLPVFQSEESRRALIVFAGLDSLSNQIRLGGTSKVFISLLLPTLVEYGTLPNECRALDAFLDAVETEIGDDRKTQLRKIRETLLEPVMKLVEYSDEDLDHYLRFIESQCATLDPRRMPRGSKTHEVVLPLKDVFITLKAGQNNPLEREAEQNLLDIEVEELILLLRLTDTEAHVNEYDFRYQKLAEEFLMLSERRREKAGIVKLHDVFCQHRWLVILGDPGSGKTTLMQWLAFQFARALLAKKDRVTVSPSQIGIQSSETEVDLGPARFPIFIRIADYASELRNKPSLALIDYLGSQPILGQHPSIQHNKLAAMSLAFLKRGEAVVLLDGLDEITDPADRRKVRDRIEEFVQAQIKDPANEAAFTPWATPVSVSSATDRWWSHFEPSSPAQIGSNQVVITSRIAGYKAAVLRSEFAHYVIEPLDDDSIARFCKEWTLAVERYLARQSKAPILDVQIEKKAFEEAEALTKSILDNKSVRKLASNPLLLTLLALLHREQSRLPTQRIRLYRQAVETLIQRRDVDLDEALVHDVLGPFALWLHENQPTGLATEIELRKQIGDALARWHGLDSSKPVAGKFSKEIDSFITTAREQGGLLVARGEGLYGFIHLTFQEYFVARELTRDPDQVTSKLTNYLHRPRWREPILFAIAYISDTQRGILERVMWSVLNAESQYEDILHRNLIFAADCVADSVWMPPTILHQIVQGLISIYADKTGQGRFKALQEQIVTAFERIYRLDTTEVIERDLINILQGDNPKLRNAASEILGRVSWGSTELFLALFRALGMPGEPGPVNLGFNAMLKKIPAPRDLLSPHVLETLTNLYRNDPEITRAINFLNSNSKQARFFLESWAEIVEPYILPLIVRSLKLYNTSASDQYVSLFLTELTVSLKSLADNSAGMVYSSAIQALALLEGPETLVEAIRINIADGKKFDESIRLFLTSFSHFLEEDKFAAWWDILLPLTKQQFFEVACYLGRSQLLEEKAWDELNNPDPGLRATALKLILQLPHATLTPQRLSLLVSFLESPNQELADIAADILERGVLAVYALEQTYLKLQFWLQSESETLRACASLLLAKSNHLTVDIYREIALALRSGNDRWRQWADRIMLNLRLASKLSMDLMSLSVSFEWEELADRRDGMASLAHTTFQRWILHDTPEYILRLIEELGASPDKRSQKMLQNALMNVGLYTTEVGDRFLQSLKVTKDPLVKEAIVSSLSWILQANVYIYMPENTISILSQVIKETHDAELRVVAAKTIGYMAFRVWPAYLELIQLCSSESVEIRSAAARGLGTLAIYTNKAKPDWQLTYDGNDWRIEQYRVNEGDIQFDRDEMRSKIFQQLKKMITSGYPELRLANLSGAFAKYVVE